MRISFNDQGRNASKGLANIAGAVLLIATCILHCEVLAQPVIRAGLPSGSTDIIAGGARRLAAAVARWQPGIPRDAESLMQGTPAALLASVQRGELAAAVIPLSSLAPVAPDFRVFDSLFLFDDLSSVERFEHSEPGRKLLTSVGNGNLTALDFWHGGMRQLASTRGSIAKPESVRGRKIVTTSMVAARQFQRAGASTSAFGGGEVYSALQSGAADSIDASSTQLQSLTQGPVTSVTLSNHRYDGFVVVLNKQFADSLSPDNREALTTSVREIGNDVNRAVKHRELQAETSLMNRSGVTVVNMSPAERLSWRRQMAPEWTSVLGQDRRALLAAADAANSSRLAARVSANPPSIVYNADISPQLPREASNPGRPVLEAGKAATLRFAIGPRWSNSLLPDDATPAVEILASKEDVRLTVILACDSCAPHAESLKRMTFSPANGHSDEIRFVLIPQRSKDGRGYEARLQLGIINDKTGSEYDRLVISFGVAGELSPSVSMPAHAPLVFSTPKTEARKQWADVVLYATQEMQRSISISIQPVSDEMKSRLSLAVDAQGQPRKFRSGIDDAKMLEAMTTSAYGMMSAVSMQGQFLKRVSATGVNPAVSAESQKSLLLTDTESTNVSGVIADIGQRLYRNLFRDTPDIDLRRLIMSIEQAAADPQRPQPLRLQIVTDQISLPWQYLHPTGPDVDPQSFWGLRFNLSVLRINTGGSRNAAPSALPGARKFVFAQYGRNSDPTVALAKEQQVRLRKLSAADIELLEVDSGSDLLSNLEKKRNEISGIFTFLHASFNADDLEPQLTFNDGDKVTSDALERLLNKLPMSDGENTSYLAGQPLVILNACETGPSVNLPHVSLENVMFKLGAQGVVVTEVSVWIQLGHDMALRLIDRLGKGEPIGDALSAVRRDLYAERKNPLGLLYVYYGDPAATLPK